MRLPLNHFFFLSKIPALLSEPHLNVTSSVKFSWIRPPELLLPLVPSCVIWKIPLFQPLTDSYCNDFFTRGFPGTHEPGLDLLYLSGVWNITDMQMKTCVSDWVRGCYFIPPLLIARALILPWCWRGVLEIKCPVGGVSCRRGFSVEPDRSEIC